MEGTTKRVEIMPVRRRAMILDHLRIRNSATIQELADAIGGSQSTVRRDLEQLTEGGYLERTHGGAVLVPSMRAAFERESSLNAQLQHPQKVAIGAEAARRLGAQESVIFESSSTVMEAVRAASDRKIPLTVVTNNLDIAKFSADVPQWQVIMPGGTIRAGSGMLAGEPGESFFKTVHADVCFTGAYAVTGNILTDATLEVASIKRAMIQSARRTLLLVDSSKFTSPAFCTICNLSDIHEIITDDGVPAEKLHGLRNSGVTVTVVPVAQRVLDQDEPGRGSIRRAS